MWWRYMVPVGACPFVEWMASVLAAVAVWVLIVYGRTAGIINVNWHRQPSLPLQHLPHPQVVNQGGQNWMHGDIAVASMYVVLMRCVLTPAALEAISVREAMPTSTNADLHHLP